jgi:hypothetical protein
MHRALPTLPRNYGHGKAGLTFVDGIRNCGIRQQLLLGGSKTPIEGLRQTQVLEGIKLTVGSSIRLRKASDRALWRSRPLPSLKEGEMQHDDLNIACC